MYYMINTFTIHVPVKISENYNPSIRPLHLNSHNRISRCYPNGKLICRSAYIPDGSVEMHENCRFVLHFLLTRERESCVSLQHRL